MKKQMVTLVTATALASALGIASQQQSASAATNAPQVTANLKTAQSNDNDQNVQPEADTNNADGTDVKTPENDSEAPAASQAPASQAPATSQEPSSEAPASQAPVASQAPSSQVPVASPASLEQSPAAVPTDNDKTDQPTASSAEEPTTNVQALKASAPAATKNVTYQTDPNLTDANGEINPGYLIDEPISEIQSETNAENLDSVTKDATLTLNIAGKEEEQRIVKNVTVKIDPEYNIFSTEVPAPQIDGYKSVSTASVKYDRDSTELNGYLVYFPINNTSTAPINKNESSLIFEIDGQKKLTYLEVDAQPWTIVTVPAPKITGYKANTDTVELGIEDDGYYMQLTDLSYTRIPNVTIPAPKPTKYYTENVTFPGVVNGKEQRIMFKNLTVKIANGDNGNPGYYFDGTYAAVKTPVLEGYKTKPTTLINMRKDHLYDKDYIWTLVDALAYFPIHNTTNAKPITTTGYVATVGDDGVSRTVTGKPWSIVTIAAPKVAGYTPSVDTIEIGISDSTEYFYVLTDLKYTKTSELGPQNSQNYTRNVTIEKGGQWTTTALNFTSKPGQTVKVKIPTVAGYKADMATMRVEINRLTGEIEQLDMPQYTKVAGATTDAKDNNNSGSTTTDSKTNNNNGSTTTGSKTNGTGNGTTTGTDSTQNQNGTTTTTTDGQKTTASTTTNHDGTTTDSLNGTNSQGTATGVGATATGAQLNGGVTTTNVATNAKGQTSLAATNADTKTTQGKTATGNTLPQTGETHQGYLAVLGAFLLGMLGLTKVSRKHRA